MKVATTTDAGSSSTPNEDLLALTRDVIVVLDGTTSRTETGCVHGTPWYVARLGSQAAASAADHRTDLADALAGAIRRTADQHRQCQLGHLGTPCATAAMVRVSGAAVEYLVLGDAVVVVQTDAQTHVVTDRRVEATARAERAEASRHPIGSEAKQVALLRMKRAELAARNRVGGYWLAAADPAVVNHAITGSLPRAGCRRLAVLTDGAARLVTRFGMLDWPGMLRLLDTAGPAELVRRLRTAEQGDPAGIRWPRNKRCDDATIAYADLGDQSR